MTTPASTHGFGLTISPASTHIFGETHATGKITVENPSSAPLHIVMSEVGLTPSGPKCTMPTHAPAWLTMHGSKAFTLAPGQEHVVNWTLNAAPHTVGSGAIVAAATPAAHSAAAASKLNVSAGSRITIGTTARCHQAPLTLPAPHASSAASPALIVAAIIAALLALLLGAWLVRRRRRHAI